MATANNPIEKPDIILVENAMKDDLENPEKAPQVLTVDGYHVLGLTEEDAEFYNNYSPEQRRRTRHKVSPAQLLRYMPPPNDTSNPN